MFFERSASRLLTSTSLSASSVSVVSATSWRWNSESDPSSSGFAAYPAFSRFLSVKASRLTISVPPLGRSRRFVFSAAGFIATSTSGASPGVRMSWSAKWSWKPETPGSEPAGARISAGKSGSVERSLPTRAVSLVNCPPVGCRPAPDSPGNRIVTCSSCSTCLAIALHGSADHGDSPCLPGGEELIRVDLVAPTDEVAFRLLRGGSVDRRAHLGLLLVPAPLELLQAALGFLRGRSLGVPLGHYPASAIRACRSRGALNIATP